MVSSAVFACFGTHSSVQDRRLQYALAHPRTCPEYRDKYVCMHMQTHIIDFLIRAGGMYIKQILVPMKGHRCTAKCCLEGSSALSKLLEPGLQRRGGKVCGGPAIGGGGGGGGGGARVAVAPLPDGAADGASAFPQLARAAADGAAANAGAWRPWRISCAATVNVATDGHGRRRARRRATALRRAAWGCGGILHQCSPPSRTLRARRLSSSLQHCKRITFPFSNNEE